MKPQYLENEGYGCGSSVTLAHALLRQAILSEKPLRVGQFCKALYLYLGFLKISEANY